MYGDDSTVGIALTKCFYCGEDDRILINSRLTTYQAKKVEEARGKVIDREPCSKCQEYMKNGVIVITIDEGKSRGDMTNPYRMGFFGVMTDAAITRMITDEDILNQVLKDRVLWLEHSVAVDMGLIAMANQMEAESKLSANRRIV